VGRAPEVERSRCGGGQLVVFTGRNPLPVRADVPEWPGISVLQGQIPATWGPDAEVFWRPPSPEDGSVSLPVSLWLLSVWVSIG
jgi:hypothetical protein